MSQSKGHSKVSVCEKLLIRELAKMPKSLSVRFSATARKELFDVTSKTPERPTRPLLRPPSLRSSRRIRQRRGVRDGESTREVVDTFAGLGWLIPDSFSCSLLKGSHFGRDCKTCDGDINKALNVRHDKCAASLVPTSTIPLRELVTKAMTSGCMFTLQTTFRLLDGSWEYAVYDLTDRCHSEGDKCRQAFEEVLAFAKISDYNDAVCGSPKRTHDFTSSIVGATDAEMPKLAYLLRQCLSRDNLFGFNRTMGAIRDLLDAKELHNVDNCSYKHEDVVNEWENLVCDWITFYEATGCGDAGDLTLGVC